MPIYEFILMLIAGCKSFAQEEWFQKKKKEKKKENTHISSHQQQYLIFSGVNISILVIYNGELRIWIRFPLTHSVATTFDVRFEMSKNRNLAFGSL